MLKPILIIFLLLAALLIFTWAVDKLGIGTKYMHVRPKGFNHNQLYELYNTEYIAVGNALIDCLSRVYHSVGLCKPMELAQHIELFPDAVVYEEGYIYPFYVYSFDRSVLPSNLEESKYNTLPVDKMCRKINTVFSKYCVTNGLAEFMVIGGSNGDEGVVQFVIGRKEFCRC